MCEFYFHFNREIAVVGLIIFSLYFDVEMNTYVPNFAREISAWRCHIRYSNFKINVFRVKTLQYYQMKAN